MHGHKNLNRLAYFAAVIDAGSFTAAAAQLGVTKAVVSQQVARLEEELNATLLIRTTRRVAATEAGRALHARCVSIFRESEQAFADLAGGADSPTGTLRITASFDYGAAVVVPALTEFARLYPACGAELSLSDSTLDLSAGRFDMAVHVGWLDDSSLVARRIGSFRQLLVCAPSIADALSRVRRPEDLERLPFVANTALRDPLRWEFSRNKTERRSVRLRSTFATDATPGVHAAVLCGAGLSVLPDFLVRADLAARRLIHVLPAWNLASGGIHAVFPAARFRAAKVNAFVDLLAEMEKSRPERHVAGATHERPPRRRKSG